ncbi:SDR family NAD(P)-dependent oxidoreductase [Actinomadura sp. 9N407]|uniref:SDR family NAD(P)-dependent oxidoreductase n=1 Tax=Actinomadura sp. 9N407 TaxID=3375154 RepID=UPI00379FA19B
MNTTSGPTSDLTGKSVIVTGAGSGIGRAAALRFAEHGAKVLVADINPGGAAEAVAEIRAKGTPAHAVVGDLSEQRIVDQVVATAVEEFGGLDVLVNNAGIMDDMSAAADVTDAVWERLLRINLTAPFLLARAALPHMLAAGKGSIVFTASEASLRGSAAGAAYTASKHGVVGLTKSLAVMYRGQGIRTNAIAPGATMTNIEYAPAPDAHGPAVLASYMGNFGQVSTAEQQASAIVFLASDAAANINGAILPVDNGWAAV